MDFLNFVRRQWDRVGAWAAIAVGALLLLLGWVGVSGTVYPAEQIPYIVSGGLGGICLVGIGAMLWISADLRDEWGELHELVRRLDGEVPEAGSEPVHEVSANGSAPVRDVVA